MRLYVQVQLQLRKTNQRAVQMALPMELYLLDHTLPAGRTVHKEKKEEGRVASVQPTVPTLYWPV